MSSSPAALEVNRVAAEGDPAAPAGEVRAPREESEYQGREMASEPAESGPAKPERSGAGQRLEERLTRSRRGVQHAGVWLLMAVAGSLGFYESAERLPRASSCLSPPASGTTQITGSTGDQGTTRWL